MKNKIMLLFISIFLIFTITSCGEVEEAPVVPEIPTLDNPVTDVPTNDIPTNVESGGDSEQQIEFVVSLTYNGRLFTPSADEKISVIWADDFSQYSKEIAEDGYAKLVLDGEFNVYLSSTPKDYTYNPNIYVVNNENPVVEIELYKISKTSKGAGTGLYSEREISNTGTYRVTIASAAKKYYYEYQPTEPGYYVIESLVSIYDDVINPKVDIYQGTFASKYFKETLDSGGSYKKGGYTKNFKWVVKLTADEVSNVYTFAIYADSKTGVYPISVDFSITYEGEYYKDQIVSKVILPKEATEATPDYSSDYEYINSDGGTGNYYGGVTNGTGLLDGKKFKYNEETGYWHFFDVATGEFGPILCVKITAPCAYYEESLNLIESHGNKNLTVSNGTENYKQFVEVWYAALCNSDGVCYVTMEMKEFLQKFSISQRLFFDGNGFVESTGVYAIEEDQWLFACGYYRLK